MEAGWGRPGVCTRGPPRARLLACLLVCLLVGGAWQVQADREAVQRLRAERDALLRSGVYAAGDALVQSLEARIAELAGPLGA